ncbi:MAG: hypothetical protein HYV29_00005, partial [Ignavibacteriales bacterium]|nr:hypothetical protein [Ignavibacteriales bacterium]
FIRYNLLNLRSFARRQRISMVFRLLMYACIVFIVGVLAGHWRGTEYFDAYVFITLSAGASVALLLSAGKKFEHYVDESLFETKLNFRKILKDSIADLNLALDDRSIFQTLLQIIHQHLPVRFAALYQVINGSLHQAGGVGDTAVSVAHDNDLLPHINGKTGSLVHLKTAKNNRDQFDYALMIRRPDGELDACVGLILEMRNDTLEDEDRDFLSSLAAETSQILNRFRLQEEIIMKKDETRRLEEMNALKSFFVSSVSHDLRLPLTSIRMYAEMLDGNGVLSAKKKREFVRTILGETGRLTRHVENILDINSIERGKFRFMFSPVDLRIVVIRAVQAMEYEIKKHSARVKTSLPKIPVIVSADEAAVEHVLMNLLSNAMKYSRRPPKISITVTKGASVASIGVADNGIGIPRNERSNIFEKFYRIHDGNISAQTGGTGIGLAVVKYIVEQHGGTIRLESTLSKGSTFTLFLPLGKK